MDDAGAGSRPTRRQVLGATAGALAVGALSGRSGAQQASGPTVYVGSGSIGEDGTLYAVDAVTGEQEWAFTQPSDAVFSSPTAVDGTVYVGSFDDTLYAVDAATGEQEWNFTQPSRSVRSSPTVVDGTVYVGSHDGTLYAVDAATGEQEWAFTRPSSRVESSPTVADSTVYVGSHDGTLYAVDAATGEQQWAFTQPSGSVDSSPTAVDGTVYVGSDDETLYAVDAATGEQEWAFTRPSDFVNSSPTVADGTVYVGSTGADFDIESVDAPDEIERNETLEVTYTIENVGNDTGTEESVRLLVDGEVADADDIVTLVAGGTTSGTLVYEGVDESFEQGETIPFTLELVTFGESTNGSTDIAESADPTGGADIQFESVDAPDEISVDDVLPVTYTIENIGNESGTESQVSLVVGNDTADSDQNVTVASGETREGVLILNNVADQFDPGDTIGFTVELSTFGDSNSGSTDIESGDGGDGGDGGDDNETAAGDLKLISVDAPDIVGPDEDLTVNYTIENVGDEAVTESFVDLRIGGALVDSDQDVTVDPGETVSGTLSRISTGYDEGETLEYAVELADFGGRLDGEVFVGTLEKSTDRTLYAVDATTGEEEWAFTQPSDFVASSPTVADGTVYVGSHDNTLYAVDTDSGDQEWKFTQPSASVGSSPTVVANPQNGDSVGSRVLLGTLGHHGERADRVTKSSPASFALTIGEAAQTQAGEPLTVAVDVENTGDEAGTGSIELSVPSLGSTSETVSLASGKVTTDFLLSLQTTEGDAGEYTATVSTDDDSAEQTVTVLAPAAFTVDITDVTDPVAGDLLEATVSVENTGDVPGEQTIELSASELGSDSTTVSLDGGEDTTETLSLSTDEGDAGEYTVTVDAGDDSTQQTVTVLEPAAFTVAITDVTAPVAGDSLAATVSVENTGDTPGEQTIELSASGLGSDSTTVSLDGGDSTTETLSLSTDEDDDGEYTVTVNAGDDDATETVTVAAPAGDGLGTTEMAAIGGGGTLALLFGAYALMRRADDGDDTTPERPSEPDTPGRATTAPRGSQSSDSSTGDTIDDLLDDVARTLDSARQSADAGEYDRALARCREAIGTAKEARATARKDALGRVSDAEATLDDATSLRKAIQAERDARQQATDALDMAEGALDDAAAALDGGSPEAALETLDGVAESLEAARASIADHELPALAERVATLEQRQERLRQAAREARTRVPAEISGVTRCSLSYADIEKRGELGRGGNADVFRATARTDGGDIDIALKQPRMSGDGTLHTETVERMMDEAETWQRLDDHDHIVGVVDYGSEPLPWIAMEHMDAGHLGERAGDLPLDQALWTAIATAEGVRHAHRRGVAHLDLKPENVLFRAVADAWDAPKVADWGLSKHLLEHSKSVEGVTPYYAAPEQFADGYGTPDDITDVYQLGAVFYELFTGRPPFEGRPMRVMRQVETEQPTPPSELADVPEGLDDVLLTALATERDERYDAVVLLRNDLQELFESV